MMQLGFNQLCSHYFVFDSPNGKDSRGVCQYCGWVIYQPNSFDYNKHDYNLNVIQVTRTPLNNVDSLLTYTKHKTDGQSISMALDNF